MGREVPGQRSRPRRRSIGSVGGHARGEVLDSTADSTQYALHAAEEIEFGQTYCACCAEDSADKTLLGVLGAKPGCPKKGVP